MPLERHEKTIGRWWREQQETALAGRQAAIPDPLLLPPHVAHARHECAALGGRNISFEVAEVYVRNQELAVCYCSTVAPPGLDFPHDDCQGGKFLKPGTIAFVYRDGECKHCGLHGISHTGFVVECASRAPLGREKRVGAGN